MMTANQTQPMCFRVVADSDPSALIGILQHLRRNNWSPKSVWAQQRSRHGYIEIKIELEGLCDETFQRLLNDINDLSFVIAAVQCKVEWTDAVRA